MPAPKGVRDLSAVQVRLLSDPAEIAEWDRLVRTNHYLRSARMMGEQLRYVAELNGYWVACLGWSAAALKLAEREAWIGWTPVRQRQRLHLVGQNARFLVLPGMEMANLASRVLALNLRLLSQDWQERYGHPIFLAETFVEAQKHDGTCYRACGWQELGLSKGFRRTAEGYRQHGVSKRILVKELRAGARRRLGGDADLAEDRPVRAVELAIQPVEPAADGSRPGLFEIIAQHVTDPRQAAGRSYPVGCLLGLVLTGMLAGETTCAGIADWARTLSQRERQRLRCPLRIGEGFRVPTANTVRYLLQDLDPAQLEAAARAWVRACGINTCTTHIAIDGKILCGSQSADGPAKAHLAAYDVHRHLVVDQIAVGERTTEVPAARVLLGRYDDLDDVLVTADAAHTNSETVTRIVEKKGSICFRSRPTNRGCWRTSRMPSPPPAPAPMSSTANTDTAATTIAN
jgi:hypothetical protein